jgi:hypothetical protein
MNGRRQSPVLMAISAILIGWVCPGYSQPEGTTSQDSILVRPSVTATAYRSAPEPGVAFRRSLVLPGWGQWYNGERYEAFAWSGIFWTSIGFAVAHWDNGIGYNGPGSIFWSRTAWTKGRNNWLILAGFTYLFCGIDAYVDAHMLTFDVEPLTNGPDPNGWKLGLSIALDQP